MGLIKQIDDQMGVLFRFLEQRGLFDNTLIVFTSDHGDYLGDHWLGEKEFFHEPSVKIPLIIYDPDRRRDARRVCDELVEAIDLAPTFLDALGADPARSVASTGRPLAHAVAARASCAGVAAIHDQRIRLFDPADGRGPWAWRRAMRACS